MKMSRVAACPNVASVGRRIDANASRMARAAKVALLVACGLGVIACTARDVPAPHSGAQDPASAPAAPDAAVRTRTASATVPAPRLVLGPPLVASCPLPHAPGASPMLSPLAQRMCEKPSRSQSRIIAEIEAKENGVVWDVDMTQPHEIFGLAVNYAEWECSVSRLCAPQTPNIYVTDDERALVRRPLDRMKAICETLRRDFPAAPEQCP